MNAAVTVLPAAAAAYCEPFTAEEVAGMLGGAVAFWAESSDGCPACPASDTGICRWHADDDRMAFLAERLSAGLAAAGPEVLSGLLTLGRKNTTGVAAVSGEGEK